MTKPEELFKDFEVNNCRVCFDIHDWKRKAQKQAFENTTRQERQAATGSIIFSSGLATMTEETQPPEYRACPPDALELGRSTWTFLHTMSVYYPDRPSSDQQREMSDFLHLFSKFYPCGYCASHLRDEMKKDPPAVDSQSGLAQWLCRMHNEVNERLGKPLFDCKNVDERWRDGPSDGSCS